MMAVKGSSRALAGSVKVPLTVKLVLAPSLVLVGLTVGMSTVGGTLATLTTTGGCAGAAVLIGNRNCHVVVAVWA